MTDKHSCVQAVEIAESLSPEPLGHWLAIGHAMAGEMCEESAPTLQDIARESYRRDGINPPALTGAQISRQQRGNKVIYGPWCPGGPLDQSEGGMV